MTDSNSTIKEQFLETEKDIFVKAVSGNIYSLMNNLRNSSSDTLYQRRWVWELLQNAMDTTNNERDTLISIKLDSEDFTLSFAHNGNPFTVDNIMRLVHQQSSKPRKVIMKERKRTIGKFGTGFITTHLLSEKVTLKSTIRANENGHKYFELLLDRSGQNESELYNGIKNAREVLLSLDLLPDVERYNNDEMNTKFIYHLDENSIETAKIGMEDLRRCLPFTMAFVKSISQVSLNNKLIYKYLGAEEITKGFFLHKINITDTGNRYILTLESEKEDATIAIEVLVEDKKITLIPLDENCSRLYCNYPFIGTEDFHIPVVFNSSSFNVYQERRNGIILKDADTEEIRENKIIIKECANLYKSLIQFIGTNVYEIKETYILADINQPFNYEWLSKKWYDTEILKPIQKYLLHAPFVEVNNSDEKSNILQEDESIKIWFPANKDIKILENIWLLASNWLTFIPKDYQYKKWNQNLFEGCPKLTIAVFCNGLNKLGKINELENKLQTNISSFKNSIEWLNTLYSIIDNDADSTKKINTNKIAIFPNQNGDFTIKSHLSLDGGDIPEELKNILARLGVDCRKKLLHKDVFLDGGIAIDREKVVEFKNIASQIKDQVIIHYSNKMKGVVLSENVLKTFRDLYFWLVENPKAGDSFGELYTNKEIWLLDGATIKKIFEHNSKTKLLLEKYGAADLDELENLLEKIERKQKESISPFSALTALGITSKDDLEKAIKEFATDKEMSNALQHISIADIEMLEAVLKMIERSKLNIKNLLALKSDYDCSRWTEDSLTTISGVLKNGRSIKLVVRPGDGSQIILFYPEEYKVLEDENNELWYDKEGKEQGEYFLGRFLKKTKVNRMPL
ncbi:MAG TPA: ATP-binding protein [Hanamia sp.]|nr:ATP-binding protein [Hanamia sp.]